uniref:Uncharacterized protein n=1 Tax=Globodera rostochiensis TaxID=31243 RepID=A0A914HP00_GLORO
MEFSDDDGPPTLDGPYPMANDSNNFLGLATPFHEAASAQHPVEASAVVSAQPKTAARPGRKEPALNKNLDVEQFNGDEWMCLAAAQASSGRFKAFRFIGRFMLNFIWGAAYPEDVLKALFSMSLAYAVKGAERNENRADHFIFLLSARPWTTNCPHKLTALLKRFSSVGKRNFSKSSRFLCNILQHLSKLRLFYPGELLREKCYNF